MCGINGFQGQFSPELIKEMNTSISHRGPDNSGESFFKQTALGHVRLSIIDLSPVSNQPMVSRCSQFEIVFNGEIYNFLHLKKILEKDGVIFKTNGDSEVLLELWAKYGEKSLTMLNGIFSFAVLDKESEVLTIVRDYFGIKPLYYTSIAQGFIFSSEIKAILQCSSVPRDINFNAVASTLELLWQPGTTTLLNSIKKLPSGSLIKVKNGVILAQEEYYISPNYKGDYSLEKSKNELEDNLVFSIESQLLADVEVGAFLSGGLDSSLICAIAKKKQPNFKKVYSIKVDSEDNEKEGFIDDLPFAKKVADHLNLELNVVESNSDIVNLLPKCIFHLDEPQADPAILNTYQICMLAKKDGIKVLLSGAGGDDFFTGYRRHYAAYLESYIAFVPKFIRKSFFIISQYLPSKVPFVRRIRKFMFSFQLNGVDKLVSYFSWGKPATIKNMFTSEIQSTITSDFGSQVLKDSIINKSYNDIERLLDLEKEFFLVDHNLNYTDKMSMAHGVEVRVPFVTKQLADVSASIPTKYKQKGREGKWILKKVAEKWLPKSIIYRKKTGFGAPLRSWLHGPLKPLIDKLLSKESIEYRGIFDYQVIKEMIYSDRIGKEDFAYTIYALLTLEIWFRQFIDCEKPRELTIKELLNS